MAHSFSISNLFPKLLHSLFPTACASCQVPLWNDRVPFFCDSCWESRSPIPDPVCPRCGRPFRSSTALHHSPTHQCGSCRKRPPAFTQTWSLFPYQTPLKEAITLLKYRGKLALAQPLTQAMIHALPPLPSVDGIIPVPLHPQRLREREFNQSHVLAHHLGSQLGIPLFRGCLLRIRPTPPQTSLAKRARLTNLHKAFSVKNPSLIKNKRILLVDDVLTTGTTLNECAKTLRRAGAGPVYGLTLARMV